MKGWHLTCASKWHGTTASSQGAFSNIVVWGNPQRCTPGGQLNISVAITVGKSGILIGFEFWKANATILDNSTSKTGGMVVALQAISGGNLLVVFEPKHAAITICKAPITRAFHEGTRHSQNLGKLHQVGMVWARGILPKKTGKRIYSRLNEVPIPMPKARHAGTFFDGSRMPRLDFGGLVLNNPP